MPRKAGNLREKFIIEYLIDQNATQAAIRAGYSEKTAYSQGQRLLKNVEISHVIAEKLQEQLKHRELSVHYVVNALIDTVERCRQAEPVYDKEGKETGEYRFEAMAAFKGLELLGKHLKMFTDKIEIDDQRTTNEIRRELERLGLTSQESVSSETQVDPSGHIN